MAANPTGPDLATAIHMAKGTEQVPRDILTMAAMARYYTFVAPDGSTWGPLPGPTVHNPTLHEADMYMRLMLTGWDSTSYTTGPYPHKGLLCLPQQTIKVRQTFAVINAVAGASYQAVIAEVDLSNVVTAMVTAPAIPYVASGQTIIAATISATLRPNVRTYLGVGRTDGSDTYPLPIVVEARSLVQAPLRPLAVGRFALANPEVGDTLGDNGTPSVPAMWFAAD